MINDFGCPNTNMHPNRAEFEASEFAVGKSLTIRKNAPHYDNHATRIAYYQWESTIPKKENHIPRLKKNHYEWITTACFIVVCISTWLFDSYPLYQTPLGIVAGISGLIAIITYLFNEGIFNSFLNE